MRVKLKTKFGQVWDRKLRWGIAAGEVKSLPEPLPQDTLTYQKLRMGGFEIVKDDVGPALPDAMDAPVVEVADVSAAKKPEPTTDVGTAVPEDVVSTDIEAKTETAATDRPTEPAPKPAPKKRGRPKKTK